MEARTAGLLSDEHSTVESAKLRAWASLKSLQPRDTPPPPPPDDPGKPTVDFHGQRRTNETHRPTTDPDAIQFRSTSDFYVGAELERARYLYFGSIGWAAFVAVSVEAVWQGRRAFATAGTVLLCVSAVCLALNLRPWTVAADLVRAMEAAADHGRDSAADARRWAEETGAPIQFEAGLPREINGVSIFLNGYPEFVRLRTRPDQTRADQTRPVTRPRLTAGRPGPR